MCQEIFQGILPKLHRLINQMLNCLFRNTLFISDMNRKSANKSHYIIIGSIRKYVNMWYLFMEKMTTTYSLEFFQAKLGVLQNLKPNAYILCSFLTQIESQLTPTTHNVSNITRRSRLRSAIHELVLLPWIQPPGIVQ